MCHGAKFSVRHVQRRASNSPKRRPQLTSNDACVVAPSKSGTCLVFFGKDEAIKVAGEFKAVALKFFRREHRDYFERERTAREALMALVNRSMM